MTIEIDTIINYIVIFVSGFLTLAVISPFGTTIKKNAHYFGISLSKGPEFFIKHIQRMCN